MGEETGEIRVYSHFPISRRALEIMVNLNNFRGVQYVRWDHFLEKPRQAPQGSGGDMGWETLYFEPEKFDFRRECLGNGCLDISCSGSGGTYRFIVGRVQQNQPRISADFDFFRLQNPNKKTWEEDDPKIFPSRVRPAVYFIDESGFQQWRWVDASWHGKSTYPRLVSWALRDAGVDERASIILRYGGEGVDGGDVYVFKASDFAKFDPIESIVHARHYPANLKFREIAMAA